MISCNINNIDFNVNQNNNNDQKNNNAKVYETIFSKKIADNEKGIAYKFYNNFYNKTTKSFVNLDKTVSFRAQKLILISIFIILNIFVASISFESFLAIIIRGTFLSAINIVIVSFFIVNMIITFDIDEKDNNAGGFTNAIFKFFNKMLDILYNLINKKDKINFFIYSIAVLIIWCCMFYFLSCFSSVNFVTYIVSYGVILTLFAYMFSSQHTSFIFQSLLCAMMQYSNNEETLNIFPQISTNINNILNTNLKLTLPSISAEVLIQQLKTVFNKMTNENLDYKTSSQALFCELIDIPGLLDFLQEQQRITNKNLEQQKSSSVQNINISKQLEDFSAEVLIQQLKTVFNKMTNENLDYKTSSQALFCELIDIPGLLDFLQEQQRITNKNLEQQKSSSVQEKKVNINNMAAHSIQKTTDSKISEVKSNNQQSIFDDFNPINANNISEHNNQKNNNFVPLFQDLSKEKSHKQESNMQQFQANMQSQFDNFNLQTLKDFEESILPLEQIPIPVDEAWNNEESILPLEQIPIPVDEAWNNESNQSLNLYKQSKANNQKNNNFVPLFQDLSKEKSHKQESNMQQFQANMQSQFDNFNLQTLKDFEESILPLEQIPVNKAWNNESNQSLNLYNQSKANIYRLLESNKVDTEILETFEELKVQWFLCTQEAEKQILQNNIEEIKNHIYDLLSTTSSQTQEQNSNLFAEQLVKKPDLNSTFVGKKDDDRFNQYLEINQEDNVKKIQVQQEEAFNYYKQQQQQQQNNLQNNLSSHDTQDLSKGIIIKQSS